MLIDPAKLAKVFVSPLQRARRTYELMFEPGTRQDLLEGGKKVNFTPDLVEWKYGDYEGLKTKEISELREQRGLNSSDW